MNKLLIVVVLFFYLLLPSRSFSQGWMKQYPGFIDDFIQTDDDGFILLTNESKIVRTDSRGNVLFEKNIGYEYGKLGKLYKSTNGDFFIQGSREKTYFLRMDRNFNLIKSTFLDGYPYKVHPQNKGLFVGYTIYSNPNNINKLAFIDLVAANTWTVTLDSPVDKFLRNGPKSCLVKTGQKYFTFEEDGKIAWEKSFLPNMPSQQIEKNDSAFVLYSDSLIVFFDKSGNIKKELKSNVKNSKLIKFSDQGLLVSKSTNNVSTRFILLNELGDSIASHSISLGDYSVFSNHNDIFIGSGDTIYRFDPEGQLRFKKTFYGEYYYRTVKIDDRDFFSYAYGNYPGFTLVKTDVLGNVFTNAITGKLFVDGNNNCKHDLGESPMRNVELLGNQGKYIGFTDSLGNYKMEVDTGITNIEAVAPNYLFTQKCPSNTYIIRFKKAYTDSSNVNFGFSATACPLLKVDISSPNLRRAFKAAHKITYCNEGISNATNVKIIAYFPTSLIPLSSNRNWILNNGEYNFDIGNLNSGQCGSIDIIDSVSSQAVLGSSACIKVTINPKNACFPSAPQWDRSSIDVASTCVEDGLVEFHIKNIGDGDMADSSSYRVYRGLELIENGRFKLKRTEQLAKATQTGGYGVRLEADERAGHPGKSMPRAIEEHCSQDDPKSLGYVASVSQNDLNEDIDISCVLIRGSFDPNDKIVSPISSLEKSNIFAGSELQYQINFQNTGNDTAFIVRIIDTLSADLDLSSFQTVQTSHNAEFSVFGEKNKVAQWTFRNIRLPDSTTNKQKSQGFVNFKVRLKKDRPARTMVNNRASIYFDFNEPVITNTTASIIADERLLGNFNKEPNVEFEILKVWPNPSTTSIVFELDKVGNKSFSIIITDVAGKEVERMNNVPARFEFMKADLNNGMYLYKVIFESGKVNTGKILFE